MGARVGVNEGATLPMVRVLAVIEDHPDMQALLSVILHRSRGFDVVAQAVSAEEALEVIPGDPGRGVIVLDQNLEGSMTGLELAPLLKERAPESRIILFTAHDLAEEAAANPFIDGFLRKDRITDLPEALRGLAASAGDSRR